MKGKHESHVPVFIVSMQCYTFDVQAHFKLYLSFIRLEETRIIQLQCTLTKAKVHDSTIVVAYNYCTILL